MRLLSGLLASQPFVSVLTGDQSLRSRPMGRGSGPPQGHGGLYHGPTRRLLGRPWLSGEALCGGSNITFRSPAPKSSPASCWPGFQPRATPSSTNRRCPGTTPNEWLPPWAPAWRPKGWTLTLHPARLKAVDIAVPGDISSAAFWMVAGLCPPRFPGFGPGGRSQSQPHWHHRRLDRYGRRRRPADRGGTPRGRRTGIGPVDHPRPAKGNGNRRRPHSQDIGRDTGLGRGRLFRQRRHSNQGRRRVEGQRV